mgnify:FL=1
MERLTKITKEEFKILTNNICLKNNGFNIIISCKYIQTWDQLAEALGNAFQFPIRNEGLDGTWDWLTDLSWLGDQKRISIYLYDEKELFKNDSSLKKQVLCWFEELIQFWEVDVKYAFIAGKPGETKEFKIYLVS